jgi:hypothetical protein
VCSATTTSEALAKRRTRASQDLETIAKVMDQSTASGRIQNTTAVTLIAIRRLRQR